MTRLLKAVGLAVLITAASALDTAQAQTAVGGLQESHNDTIARVNGGRVGIISGGIDGTYIRMATDLSSVLDDGDRIRVLPIMGKGSVQNVSDILYLKGIDIGIVQSDVLDFMKRDGAHRDIDSRIHYITKLHDEEFHLVAASGFSDIKQLARRKVNFGVKGSGSAMTAATVFSSLGVEVVPVHYDQALAIEKIRKGEIAATVYMAGKPAPAISELKRKVGFRLLPVPLTEELQETYLPARISASDYPKLVKRGASVDTIAVGAVMAVFNWQPTSTRYQRVARFIDTFFSNFDDLKKTPRHRKWREVDLAAELPGWTRFSYAEQWLAENKPESQVSTTEAFKKFVAAQGPNSGFSQPELEALFKKFVQWQQIKQ